MTAKPHEAYRDTLSRLAGDLSLPVNQEGPVFAAPWQGQAFAMALKLHEGEHFAWSEFADHLAQEIAKAGETADPSGSDYYAHWLKACERLIFEKGLLSPEEIEARSEEIRAIRRHEHD